MADLTACSINSAGRKTLRGFFRVAFALDVTRETIPEFAIRHPQFVPWTFVG
jgi:hypothetical protein